MQNNSKSTESWSLLFCVIQLTLGRGSAFEYADLPNETPLENPDFPFCIGYPG